MTEKIRNNLTEVFTEKNTLPPEGLKTEGLRCWSELKIALREAGIILFQSSAEKIRIRDLGMMMCGIVENPSLSRDEAYKQLLIILEKYELPTTKMHKRKNSDATSRKATMIKRIKEIFPYVES